MEEKFDFENLVAWQKAIEFTNLILEKTDTFYKSNSNFRLREQLDACSSSIPMNIAEGKGRFTKKEFKQFLYYSRGSLNETVTLLYLLQKRSLLSLEDYVLLKNKAIELSKILNGLINSLK
ncbi:MAG: four helix bundle protein [Saprospiraceae bacterium]|nr:four helix bundle protein [Saprospiraceae bacterium]MBK8852967.1 four helix bundle protein [Saprospiraceae bacterium]